MPGRRLNLGHLFHFDQLRGVLMYFRNLMFFRIPTGFVVQDLEEGLAECALKPVGGLELSSRGFVSPYGRDSDVLAVRQEKAIWLSVGGEDRVLPAAVVNGLLAKKLAEIEQAEGRKPGGRTRKRIKDEIIVDLIPRAFVKPSRTEAIIDLELGLVIVDTANRKVGESVIGEIRRALGSFPALPLSAEIDPRSILTSLVAGDQMPYGLNLSDECELRDPVDYGAKARFTNTELESEEVHKHLEAGMQATRLALRFFDRFRFVLGEDLVARKFELDDSVQAEYEDDDGLIAELNARFSLMLGEIKGLFTVLESAFKLSKA